MTSIDTQRTEQLIKQIGSFIHAVAQEQKVSERELSRRTGLSVACISGIINGEKGSLSTVIKAMQGLNIENIFFDGMKERIRKSKEEQIRNAKVQIEKLEKELQEL